MSGAMTIPSSLSEIPNKLGATVDGQELKILLDAGLKWLKANQQIVNSLNVFPVPDGDTGTNMVLTLQAAQTEISAIPDLNVGKIAHAYAQGALMGARGNSGVILSQILRGFSRAIDSKDTMNSALFVSALVEARNTAYKGVVRPVEGTILTVAKDMAAAGEQALSETEDITVILEKVVQAADESVRRTPELLPILKQANVVDSGGKGLFFILEGILRFLKGQPIDTSIETVQPLESMNFDNAMETIEPGQDYEVVVDFKPFSTLDTERYYNDLSLIGTSIQLGEGDGFYRMHIHVPAEKRYQPIDYTLQVGTVTKVAIENLIAQMEEKKAAQPTQLEFFPVEPGHIAVIAVSPGTGISRIFASLGVAGVVEGGQTMNPSTEQILKSFEDLPTDQVILLPNNKNIIMAAQNAITTTVKKVAVIPSTSVPQGLSALLHLSPDGDFDQVVKNMTTALKDVDTGEITIATRTVNIGDVEVREGEIIALLNGKLVASSASLQDACLDLLMKADLDSRERISLFYGNNIDFNEVNSIVDVIKNSYPSFEFEVHEGGQPHYQFIIAIE